MKTQLSPLYNSPLIDNSDRVGDYQVSIVAGQNVIAGFQCDNLYDAEKCAKRLAKWRKVRGLRTRYAIIREIIGKDHRGLHYSEGYKLKLSQP